jgi:coenzyme F420-0:L-glutamate ligase/coenzyme F420-1:gamma-L-glutamate ligase
MQEMRLIGLHSRQEIGPGMDLIQFVAGLCTRQEVVLRPGDILVLAQKIVSKSENRRVVLDEIEASQPAREMAAVSGRDARICELMLRESSKVVRCTPHVIIMRHKSGVVLANAGIDRSNVEQLGERETVLLWPQNPDASARRLHEAASRRLGFSLPVIINDSLGRAWRRGTVGTAIGAAGLECLRDLRGKPDRHGFRLQTSELGAADEVAAAASLLMGQADESVPAVIVRGAPVPAASDACAADLIRAQKEDLFP